MTLDWQSNRALNDRLPWLPWPLGTQTIVQPQCFDLGVLRPSAIFNKSPEARAQRLKKTSHMCHMLTFHEIWNSATFGTRLVMNPHHPQWFLQAQRLCVLVPNQAVSKHAPSARRRRRGVPTGRSASGRHTDPRLGRQVQPTRNPSRTGLTFPNFYSLSAQVSADHFSCGSGIAHMRCKTDVIANAWNWDEFQKSYNLVWKCSIIERESFFKALPQNTQDWIILVCTRDTTPR